MKDYISKNVNRIIPVGYSAADVREILMDTANYMSCEISDSPSSRSDFFGINSYSWCGDSSYTASGYNVLTDDFSNISLSVFFSEYGCNDVKPRIFTEVAALYGVDMTQAFSGGLVYEWTQEPNQYGLIELNDNGTVTLLTDYANLEGQYKKLDTNRIQSSNSTQTSIKPPECSSSLITTSSFLNTFNLPTRPTKIEDMINNGLPNAPTGNLISVKTTTIPETVYDNKGNIITGIKLQVLDSGNSSAPGATSSSSTTIGPNASASSTSSTSTASSTKASAAGKTSFSWFLGVLSGAFVIVTNLL